MRKICQQITLYNLSSTGLLLKEDMQWNNKPLIEIKRGSEKYYASRKISARIIYQNTENIRSEA